MQAKQMGLHANLTSRGQGYAPMPSAAVSAHRALTCVRLLSTVSKMGAPIEMSVPGELASWLDLHTHHISSPGASTCCVP